MFCSAVFQHSGYSGPRPMQSRAAAGAWSCRKTSRHSFFRRTFQLEPVARQLSSWLQVICSACRWRGRIICRSVTGHELTAAARQVCAYYGIFVRLLACNTLPFVVWCRAFYPGLLSAGENFYFSRANRKRPPACCVGKARRQGVCAVVRQRIGVFPRGSSAAAPADCQRCFRAYLGPSFTLVGPARGSR